MSVSLSVSANVSLSVSENVSENVPVLSSRWTAEVGSVTRHIKYQTPDRDLRVGD